MGTWPSISKAASRTPRWKPLKNKVSLHQWLLFYASGGRFFLGWDSTRFSDDPWQLGGDELPTWQWMLFDIFVVGVASLVLVNVRRFRECFPAHQNLFLGLKLPDSSTSSFQSVLDFQKKSRTLKLLFT